MPPGFSIDADLKGRRSFKDTSVHWTFGKLSNLALDKRWGRLITTFNTETEQIETKRVATVSGDRSHDVHEILLKTGDSAICSGDQRFWTRTGWKTLRDITIGESLACLKVSKLWWAQVVSIRPMASAQLFTLTLEDNDAYVVNNFIASTT
jgi:hypothetical protein